MAPLESIFERGRGATLFPRCRIPNVSHVPAAKPVTFRPLSEYIAHRISSPYNRDFRMLFVGSPGSGKSWAALYLAERVATHLAEIHGRPTTDFFNASNIIYGTPENVQYALQNIRQHNIYVFDDIGVSVNSREFASQANKWFSNVFQTCRTDNAAILMTVPDSFLLDKVPRTLIHLFAEMHPTIWGSTSKARVFRVVRNYRSNKTYYHYLRAGDVVFTTHLFKKPSEEIVFEYARLREDVAAIAKQHNSRSLVPTSSVAAALEIHQFLKKYPTSLANAIRIYNQQNRTEFSYSAIYKSLGNRGLSLPTKERSP